MANEVFRERSRRQGKRGPDRDAGARERRHPAGGMIAGPRTDALDPFTNTRFRVEIEGMRSTGAMEVVLPEARIVRSPRRALQTRCGNLVLKRGLTASADWYGWWDRARRSKMAPKAIVRVVMIDGR